VNGVRALRAATKAQGGARGLPVGESRRGHDTALGVSGRKGVSSLNRNRLTATLASQVNREAALSGARGGTGGRVGARAAVSEERQGTSEIEATTGKAASSHSVKRSGAGGRRGRGTLLERHARCIVGRSIKVGERRIAAPSAAA